MIEPTPLALALEAPSPAWVAGLVSIADVGVLAEPLDRVAYARDRWPLANDAMRHGALVRGLPAVVVQPATSEAVAAVLRFAAERGVPVVPYGLGSGVLGGASAGSGELVLDLRRLDAVIAIDERDGLATVQAGINGGQLEALLRARGLTAGHYPQSINISTVGGWLACRGSGQSSSLYGSIEHLVAGAKVVTAGGGLIDIKPEPRRSTGPGLLDLFLGSEGTLGVFVEVTLRVFEAPAVEIRHAVALPDHAAGLDVLRAISRAGLRPAIARLYDEHESSYRLRGYPAEGRSVICMFTFAGIPAVARAEADATLEIAAARGGVDLGEGPLLTWERLRYDSYSARHMAAGKLMDTIDIAARWSALPDVYERARADVLALAPGTEFGAHWSHVYPDGACMYMSIVLPVAEPAVQRAWHEAAWEAVMRRSLEAGATIGHHHGVGRHRARWLREELGGAAFEALVAVKKALDPAGILNPGVLGL